MKTNFVRLFLVILTWGVASAPLSARAEDWKGRPKTQEWKAGALTGLGMVDGAPGFALLGNISKRIVGEGFIPDVNNSVYVELQMGPIFLGPVAFAYSAHLRWEFVKDETWTLYAVGGLGGNVLGRFQLLPRVGVGAMWTFSPVIGIRAEVGHEYILAGVAIPF